MEDKYAKLHEAYHDKVYAQTNVLDGIFRNACEMYRRMYGRLMPEDKKAAIADIACGAGQFLKFCLNHGYENIAGVELSKGQVRYIQDNVTDKVIFQDGLRFLENHPHTFDLIVANDFIEHLTKAKGIEFVGLVHGALKPGGRIIMKTGNMAAFGGLVIWCNGLDHECGYTERSLRVLLSIWDFGQIEIIPYEERRWLYNFSQKTFHMVLRMMYKYLYAGVYPKCYTKVIAVTGVKQ